MGRRLLVAAVAALAMLAGCGGGEDGTDRAQEGPRPADAAYAAKANSICAKGVAQTRRLGEYLARAEISPTASDLLAVTTQRLVAPGIRIRVEMANRLRALGSPAEGGEAVEAYLDLFDPLEQLSRLRLQAGRDGDIEEARRLEGLMQELGEEQEAAARLAGLEVCATNLVLAAFGN